jgi:hypothetical protein
MIPGDDLRSGHRAERQDGTGKLTSRLRRNQRKSDQGDRPLHPDAVDARMNLIIAKEETVHPAGKIGVFWYISLSKSTCELQISVEIRDRNFCLIKNYDRLAYISYRYDCNILF